MTQTAIPGTEPPEADDRRLGAFPAVPTGTLVVPGKPMPMARVRFKRDGPAYTPKDRIARKGDFTQLWVDARQPRFGKGVALEAEFEFVFDRPKSHFGTGRNADLLKTSAPGYPGKNCGDLDNLEKLVKDALTGVAYADDSQITAQSSAKRYVRPGEVPHTRIVIRVRA